MPQRREDDDEQPRWLHFTRRIDAGHILQAIAFVATTIISGVGIYIFVLGRLAGHDEHLSKLDLQVGTNKEWIARVEAGQHEFANEMRSKLDKVIDMIGDIRERQGNTNGLRR